MKENCICIRDYINTDNSPEDFEKYRKILAEKLNDPGILDRSTILSDSSPLKKEAQSIIDAFEAVTNGMENPGAIEALKNIKKHSPLIDWKYLTLAIKAFYTGNFVRMMDYVNSIDENTPPYKLGKLLIHLSGIKELKSINRSRERFIKKITEDRSLYKSALEQIADALALDMEEIFTQTSILVMRELRSKYKTAAMKLALWCIQTSLERDFNQKPLFNGCKTIFGEVEGFRLYAIAFSKSEPDMSILFWMQSLSALLKQGEISRNRIGAYLTIISSQIDTAFPGGAMEEADDDFTKGFGSLVIRLCQECSLLFPDVVKGYNELNTPFDSFYQLKSEITGKTILKHRYGAPKVPGHQPLTEKKHEQNRAVKTPSVKEAERKPAAPGKNREPVQLSLF